MLTALDPRDVRDEVQENFKEWENVRRRRPGGGVADHRQSEEQAHPAQGGVCREDGDASEKPPPSKQPVDEEKRWPYYVFCIDHGPQQIPEHLLMGADTVIAHIATQEEKASCP